MKKRFFKTLCCAFAVSALLSCANVKDGSLEDITKPYLGEYHCISATLGDREYVDDFSFITLDLKKDGAFVLRYETKEGIKGEQSGEYVYDKESETVTFSIGGKNPLKKRFPLKDGKIQIDFRVGKKMFNVKLQQGG